MSNPYKARVDVRRFLNLPGFHVGAYVVAYVEDTSARELTKRDPFGYEGSRYVNPQPRIILEIADCSQRINLEFEVDSELDVDNSLHKVDVLAAALRVPRRARRGGPPLPRARAGGGAAQPDHVAAASEARAPQRASVAVARGANKCPFSIDSVAGSDNELYTHLGPTTNFIPILYPAHPISAAFRAPEMACSS
jgi:hypothetical protein